MSTPAEVPVATLRAVLAVAEYMRRGEPPVCPRCGTYTHADSRHQLPDCVSFGLVHADTCVYYRWADDVCHQCMSDMS